MPFCGMMCVSDGRGGREFSMPFGETLLCHFVVCCVLMTAVEGVNAQNITFCGMMCVNDGRGGRECTEYQTW